MIALRAARFLLIVLYPVFSCFASPQTEAEQHLRMLRHGDLEVGVLPELGGRIVLLRKQGSHNMLRENQSFWHPENWPQSVHANTRRSVFFGHIHWLAPQSAWWQQQDLDPQQQGRDWPPDPFLELGRYEVLEQTPARLVVRSPESPVSGVVLTKVFELVSENSLRIIAEARNVRNSAVSWGLWSNARFPADTRFRAALAGVTEEDIRYSDGAAFRGSVSEDAQWFTFANDPESLRVETSAASKAFINTSSPRFEIAFADWILVTSLADPLPSRIHPEHATAEVFLMKHPRSDHAFLELEFHGAYQTLQRNESVTIAELWQILPAQTD